ncbi:hypothetical protein AALO_G00153740 [Alosa alosa]|uniref:Uncharacterized protein n=1 Tax=Alosa alosa TaxID=278164 RepID=A0AAV6GEP2_9TELE|nr:hypothetical protein AALO_G00153740 [Alosa alosa]
MEKSGGDTDSKSAQDLTAVVQTLLQQMQDKFQTMLEWKRARERASRKKRRKRHPKAGCQEQTNFRKQHRLHTSRAVSPFFKNN